MTDLTHQQAHDFIQQAFLTEDDRAALRQHLAGCPECRTYAAMHVRLMQELPLPAARTQPTPAQRAAVRAAVAGARPAPRALRPLVSLAGLAMVAVLLAAAWLSGRGGQAAATQQVPAPMATVLAVLERPMATPTPDARGRYVLDTVPAPSLQGNTIGEPLQQQAVVYLPPSYDTSDRRYPVVYLLLPPPGTGVDWLENMAAYVRSAMNLTLHDDPADELIIVMPYSVNALGAYNLFVDSPVAGDWPAYLSTDLVGYVDAHYRTLAEPAARGLLGVSCAALGALDTVTTYPDVYGAAYLMRPLLFAPGTLGQSSYFSPIARAALLDLQHELSALAPEAAPARVRGTLDGEAADLALVAQEAVAYGIAFAPTADARPPYFDYPYADAQGPADPAVLQRWEDGPATLLARLSSNATALRRLALAVSDTEGSAGRFVPTQDEGVAHLLERLGDAGIAYDSQTVATTELEELGRTAFPFMAGSLARE